MGGVLTCGWVDGRVSVEINRNAVGPQAQEAELEKNDIKSWPFCVKMPPTPLIHDRTLDHGGIPTQISIGLGLFTLMDTYPAPDSSAPSVGFVQFNPASAYKDAHAVEEEEENNLY